jgi:hypothetical protein
MRLHQAPNRDDCLVGHLHLDLVSASLGGRRTWRRLRGCARQGPMSLPQSNVGKEETSSFFQLARVRKGAHGVGWETPHICAELRSINAHNTVSKLYLINLTA